MSFELMIVSGHDWISKLVMLLVSISRGLVIRRVWSHAVVRINGVIYSASMKGFERLPADHYVVEKYRIATFSIPLPEEKILVLRDMAERMVGTKYSYSFYIIEACRISLFFLGIGALASVWFSPNVAFVLVLLAAVAVGVWVALNKNDKETVHCAESATMLLMAAIDMYPIGGRPRGESPDSLYALGKTLCALGVARGGVECP